MIAAARPHKTLADLHPEDRAELIDGAIIEKAAPLLTHGVAQGSTFAWIKRHFGGPPEGGPPGWWLATEVHIQIGPGRIVCPDVAGWRKDRHPTLFSRAREWPLAEAPDWICEVLSDSNAKHDLQTKVALYDDAHIAHYWVLDPLARCLFVYRWTPEGYLLALHAGAGVTVYAEPFDTVELDVAFLLPPEPA